jgi:hypothetical protein
VVAYPTLAAAAASTLQVSVRVAHNFTWLLPLSTFACSDGESVVYLVQATNLTQVQPLPPWLRALQTPQDLNLTGIPPPSSIGDVVLQLTALRYDNPAINATAALTLHVEDNMRPVLANAISNVLATQGEAFKMAIPSDTLYD